MRLDWSKYRLILIALIFLTSCGQVGTISGGAIDERAPKPISNEVQPPLGSKNTSPDKIIIPFDEYIALNKPAQNITVTPKDVELDYAIKGKSLVLSVKEGSWAENTTYSIYLNRAVKDITEANDSIMHYVFSTGSYVDSLQAGFMVGSAYNQEPLEDITVGLFEQKLTSDTASVSPKYFNTTNKKGIAKFKYLKKDRYFVYAYRDDNKNSSLDENEWRGKIKQPFSPLLVDTIVDTISLMPPPSGPLKVLSNEFIAPGIWCVGFNHPVPDTLTIKPTYDTVFFGEEWSVSRDSITLFLKNDLSGTASFLIEDPNNREAVDTVKKRFFFKEAPSLNATNNLRGNILPYGDTLLLKWNDPIFSFDPGQVQCFLYANDSIRESTRFKMSLIRPNKLKIISHNLKEGVKAGLSIPPDAINGENLSLSDTLYLSFTTGKAKDVGTIIFNFDVVPKNGVLFLLNRKGEEVHRLDIVKNNVIVKDIQPGSYRYALLLDNNDNGVWDTGNIFTNEDPEKIIWFKQPVTVRGNWEVETSVEWK